MIIDTHSHLNFKAYDADREEVIKRTQEAGVVCIDVGTKYETSKQAIELAENNEGIYAAIGLHPIHIKTDLMKLHMDLDEGDFAPLGEVFDAKKYRELAKSNRVVAIGEVGLDYYYKPKGTTKKEEFKENQRKIFIQQLELAQELSLPVIVHCRMAHSDALQILAQHKVAGTIHCFTGTWEEAESYLNLGFHIGINGIIFKFDIDEIIKKISLDKIVVETDCPYLTPLPAIALAKEGTDNYVRNEPIFVKYVIQKIADLKGLSFDEVASATTANAKKLFKI